MSYSTQPVFPASNAYLAGNIFLDILLLKYFTKWQSVCSEDQGTFLQLAMTCLVSVRRTSVAAGLMHA